MAVRVRASAAARLWLEYFFGISQKLTPIILGNYWGRPLGRSFGAEKPVQTQSRRRRSPVIFASFDRSKEEVDGLEVK
jgi:hypothetical protein